MKTIRGYAQIYPLKEFPRLKEFYNKIAEQNKTDSWRLFVGHSVGQGLKVIVHVLPQCEKDEQIYDAYVSMVCGPINDLFYIGRGAERTEADVVKMLEEYSERFFSDGMDKEQVQKFIIDELLANDFIENT